MKPDKCQGCGHGRTQLHLCRADMPKKWKRTAWLCVRCETGKLWWTGSGWVPFTRVPSTRKAD